jgi:hypothetical protein
MITIANTGNLVEVAWIVMGIWATVRLFGDIKHSFESWRDSNNYWRKRYDMLEKDLETMQTELMESKK